MKEGVILIRTAGIVPESFSDGPGIRFVVFAQGCRHQCPGCHNPHAHSFEGGTLMEVENILSLLEQNPLLDGVTFSGGDPFEQANAFGELAEKARARGYNVMTYTGWRYEELLEISDSKQMRLLKATDILMDGRFELTLKSELLPFRGSSNQRMIDVPRSLEENQVCCIA